MSKRGIPEWQRSPFVKILPAFIAGIILCSALQLSATTGWTIVLLSIIALWILSRMPLPVQFAWRYLHTFLLCACLLAAGMLVTIYNDPRQHPHWIGHHPHASMFVVTIREPLYEKENSYKTTATFSAAGNSLPIQPATGRLLLYLQKDTVNARLQYGDQIVFIRTLQPVKNTLNPGNFDHKNWCERQGIYHQVYLRSSEIHLLQTAENNLNWVEKFVFRTRKKILHILEKNIHGKKECGLAAALLIGYKADLDKDLLQSYSNTGIVHVIAVSGLHLGLIYLLLQWLCRPMGNRFTAQILRLIIIVTGLWTFSLLAGASPSVLRAALMFSSIAIANMSQSNQTTLNSLFASAFLLLAYQPQWLWDAGFQLSYLALLGIFIFQQPIHNLFTFSNRIAASIWKLSAATIAAQILTLPVILFHFHQFPNLFLFTNLIAVPLSGIILLATIFLCCIAWCTPVAQLTGIVIQWLIKCMNGLAEKSSRLPFAYSDNIEIGLSQTLLLYAFIACTAIWLLQRNKQYFIPALLSGCAFICIDASGRYHSAVQKKIVVYHIPRSTALDFIEGDHFFHTGPPSRETDPHVQSLLQPTRRVFRVGGSSQSLPGLLHSSHIFQFHHTSLVLLDPSSPFCSADLPTAEPLKADLLLVSHNPPADPASILKKIHCRQVIIDGSCSPAFSARWERICARSGIAFHHTSGKGAFVMTMY